MAFFLLCSQQTASNWTIPTSVYKSQRQTSLHRTSLLTEGAFQGNMTNTFHKKCHRVKHTHNSPTFQESSDKAENKRLWVEKTKQTSTRKEFRCCNFCTNVKITAEVNDWVHRADWFLLDSRAVRHVAIGLFCLGVCVYLAGKKSWILMSGELFCGQSYSLCVYFYMILSFHVWYI